MKILLSLPFICLFYLSTFGQSTDIEALASQLISLENPTHTKEAFQGTFSQARIIGLGAITHGTREFSI